MDDMQNSVPLQQLEQTLANASNFQVPNYIQKLYSSAYTDPLSNARLGATVNVDKINKYNDEIARQNRIDEIKKRMGEINDLQDPAKYQMVKQQDGSLVFFNPKGEQISAGEYARVQGKNVTDVLENSDNMYQQQFRAGYSVVKDVAQAFYTNDKEALLKALGGKADKNGNLTFSSPQGEQAYEDFRSGMTVDEFSKKFLNQFKDVFGETYPGGIPQENFQGLQGRSPSLGDRTRGLINKVFGTNYDTSPYR